MRLDYGQVLEILNASQGSWDFLTRFLHSEAEDCAGKRERGDR
jgi:hypothetical protein